MANQKANQQFTLKKVQAQFEDWRKTRKNRGFIPEALWDAAISLAGPYSLYQIKRITSKPHRAEGPGGNLAQRYTRGSHPNHLC